MNKSFNADVIMDYLCPNGIDGEKYDIIPLTKEYMPEGNISERLRLQSILQSLKDKQWIDVLDDSLMHLGSNRPSSTWEGRKLSIKLKSTEYCDKKNQQPPNYQVTFQNSSGIAFHSPGATINIDNSKATSIISDIRNAIIKEENIDAGSKAEALAALEKVDSEIKDGSLQQPTFKSLLDVLSKFAGIGSLVTNLIRLVVGI